MAATTAAAAPAATANAVPAATSIPPPAAPTSKAPALTTSGTNWPTVVGSLTTYGRWLLANPNPTLTGPVTEPGCSADDALAASLQTYVDESSYVLPDAPTLTSIVCPTGSVGAQVVIDIEATRGIGPVYDRRQTANTRQRSELAALPPTEFSLTLTRGADSRWHICSVNTEDPPDREAITVCSEPMSPGLSVGLPERRPTT
ncbi:hypothetical protein ACTI_73700 [Actinoplanes sp. OR16]|uniref:hypothetical protein n=1 Tax=Actinoplanes sp. OR16 TaxID=946334 RepID=UPI000F6E2274|nr:hypothetical protein [Actinoplanes sp. OR16]BBH70685.1 hypothetical protein ACTI_73700 [Actinoplanes sp. OR16]